MANRYWVGGDGTWDASSSAHWASTSGGAGGASVPGYWTHSVFFDENSGGGAVDIESSGFDAAVFDFNTTGWTGSFVSGSYVRIADSLTIGSGQIHPNLAISGALASGTSTWTFNGSSVGRIYLGYVNDGSTATYSLNDDLTCSVFLNFSSVGSSGTTTFNTNNHNVTAGYFIRSIDGTGTPSVVLNMGTGTWTATSTGTIWNMKGATSLTINPSSSTFKVTSISSSSTTFIGDGMTFNNIWYSRSASTGSNTITGSNTFNDFKDTGTGTHSILFGAGSETTLNTFSVSGNLGKLISINTSSSTSTHSLTNASGGDISCQYLNVQHSVATGGTWDAGVTSTNNQSVATAGSGWTFNIKGSFTNPGNVYVSDNVYSTLTASSGALNVELSKDGGSNWSSILTKTFTSTEGYLTYGDGSTELWGTTWNRSNLNDTNFRIRVSSNACQQVYKNFGFLNGHDTLTGIEVSIEAKYSSSVISIDLIRIKIYYGTSLLEIQQGTRVFVSDARKNGEGVGAGTGNLAYHDGSEWRSYDTSETIVQ